MRSGEGSNMSGARASEDSGDIAIIGMSLRFPGAASPERYWENLVRGVESIAVFSDQELRAAGVSEELLADPLALRAGGVLEGIERFDAPFFGFSRREAEVSDPQHRLMLECCWEALENAGCDPDTFVGSIGVFAGASFSTYLLHNLYPHGDLVESIGGQRVLMGNSSDFLTTSISYRLNLRGPSVTVQTACSTSLVAVHLAWQSLLNGECDIALAGGVSIGLPQKKASHYQEGGVQSPDGRCRAFDAAAAGTVRGNGIGVVVLKRLDEALADGDTVYALIKGSAVNNDGSGKIGYTAPSITGQSAVVAEALAVAGVDPEAIGYVEAHGTGTNLGDPTEIAALTRAYRFGTSQKGFCAIGSVKTNIGHLDTAAGVAGLIKAVLVLHHGQIPPTLHFREPNPKCDFPSSPFKVADRLLEWPRGSSPRRAGVSSLGIGGTNAHVILEEAPEVGETDPSRPWQLLVLSARTPAALKAVTARLRDHLRSNPSLDLGDVAFTCQVGRKAFEHRRTVVCRDLKDAVRALERGKGGRPEDVQETRNRPVIFLFPGQGMQRPDTGAELYRAEPTFRETVDRCCERLCSYLGFDLRRVLLAEGEAVEEEGRRLAEAAVAQPALFVLEYALAQLWVSWEIRPQAMIGHSLGEYAAAAVAGVFSLDDALELIVERGRLVQDLLPGAMLAVSLAERELLPLLGADLSFAAANAPARSVVSGSELAIAALEARLDELQVTHRRLATRHAFHSAMMEPALKAFSRAIRKVKLHPPSIPFLSSLTGTFISNAEATDPDYWVRQMRAPVRFDAGVSELLKDRERVWLEVGPGRTLCSLVRQQPDAAGRVVVASLGDGREPAAAAVLGALGRLWLSGLAVDWAAFHAGEHRRRLPLPAYPFERQRYWIDPPTAARSAPVVAAAPQPAAEAFLEMAGPEPPARRLRILNCLLEIVCGLMGLQAQEIDPRASFLDMGIDSLLLIQFSQAVERRLGARLSLGRLLEEAVSLEAVSEVLDRELAPEVLAIEPARSGSPSVAPATLAPPLTVGAPGADLAAAGSADFVPMSPAQQQLWLVMQLGEEASRAYNESLTLQLTGELRREALRRALQDAVDRHDALRLTFPEGEGVRLAPRWSLELPEVDLSGLAEATRGARLREWQALEAGRIFDLERGPLLRVCLLRLGRRRYALILSYAHILLDGRSLGLLLAELGRLYQAASESMTTRLAEPERRSDRRVPTLEARESGAIEEALAWWRRRLTPPLPVLELPTDRTRPALFSYRGGLESLAFETRLCGELRSLGLRCRATPFLTFFAGFAVLMHRLSGQEDLVLGIPSIDASEDHQTLTGYDVNLLPIRSRIHAGTTFSTLLTDLRREVAAAYEHRRAPFNAVVRQLGLEPDFSRPPLAAVLFNLGRVEAALLFGDLEVEIQVNSTGGAKFDLSLNVLDQGGRVRLDCEYYGALFDAATVRRWLRHLATLLAATAGDPGRPVAELPLLGDGEQHQLLYEWNDTGRAVPRDICLSRLFEAQVARSPDRGALSAEGDRLTYRELNARANRLARFLVRRGVKAETPVGVCLERALDLVIALLAILKAGGAYVPLDPTYPRARLACMLEDALVGAEGSVLLTQRSLLDRLEEAPDRIFCLEDEREAIACEGPGDLPGAATALNLAYVLYTSGSTGRPKGVQITHRSLVNFMLSMRERPGFEPGERLLALTSVSFDIAGLEIYLPLLAGGEILLLGRAQADRLIDGSAAAWNMYGPTETTIWSAVSRLGRAGSGWASLGRPIANTGIVLLGPDLRPVPIGMPGELCIGGAGLARGYRGGADLTAERFLPHAWSTEPGERLYRTGDLARCRPDGEIEFVGRLDQQVKVRGFRVELGEVESALAEHPAVQEGVVVARQSAGEARLVAYVVPRGAAPPVDELRSHLAERLPPYMVPATFTMLESLPLTPNGKVDRKALPAPASFRPELAKAFVAPVSELEHTLVEIWKSVLGVHQVGIEDSFFVLGGDSILVMQAVSIAQRAGIR